jgi:precorrin-2/cobalt-factor-2 C20-methyltransferase
MSGTARLIGVGVGPGDPELVTLKALRALRDADVVAHFAKNGNASRGRAIAAGHIRRDAIELPLLYPVTIEIPKDAPAYGAKIAAFYDDSAAAVAAHLDERRSVAVICEGDPLFYGSYMHLHVRLASRYPTEVIAGVTGMSGCWSAIGAPIAQGDDVFTVLPATLGEDELASRLADTDAAAVMKLGRNLPKVRRALDRAGRLGGAMYIERGTMADAVVMPLADKRDDGAPYFAMVLVAGWEQRPGEVSTRMESLECHPPRKRGIQYSAAPEVTGSPAFAGDDSGEIGAPPGFHSTGNGSKGGKG